MAKISQSWRGGSKFFGVKCTEGEVSCLVEER